MAVQLSAFASVFLFRIVLPIIALGATIVRFNCFSLLYGCLLLVSSLLPKPSPITLKGATGRFLIVSAVLCTLTLVAQVTFQVVLLAIRTDEKPYGTVLTNCSVLESTLRQIGLQRLEPNDFFNITRVILPDIVMFITAVIVCMACFRLCRDELSADDSGYEGVGPGLGNGVKKRVIDKTLAIALYAYGILTMILLWFSGIAYPSLLSMVYFVAFISVATFWSCYGHFGSKLAIMRLLMLTYCAAHLIVLYLYQFQFFQETLSHETFVARLVGLTGIIRTDCYKPWVLKFHDDDIKWSMYVSAAMILLLYLRLAHEIRCWKKLPKEIDLSQLLRTRRMSPARSRHELDPEQEVVPRRKTESLVPGRTPGPPDTSAVPVEVSDDVLESGQGEGCRSRDLTLPLQSEDNGVNDVNISVVPQVDTPASNAPMKRTVLMSVCVFIMKQSYVFALIIMMTWSITFHSWLTFIYLMAACLIWIMPKKRQVCLKCSPLILIYAEVLLFIQYIYGFNLKELPSTIYEGWPLKEIGLVKYKNPAVALLVQVAYTVVFWLLMRQRKRERLMARRQTQPPDMQLETTTHSKSRILPSITDMVDGVDGQTVQAIGKFLHHILSKYWILVCAALFLVMAILEAVVFRIIYMVLFLYFILTFQVTYRWWRFSIKAFWWLVIIYSMVVLCLIYTYQFEHVPAFWMNVTGLQNTTLSDIGLETFDTATLFAKLLTPTSFLIVIIIQLHYFQKGFLIISDENRFRSSTESPESNNAEANTQRNAEVAGSTEIHMDRSEMADQTHLTADVTDGKQSRWLKRRFARYWLLCYDIVNKLSVLLWQFLEVHIFKAVVLTIFCCCIAEVTALNLIYVLIVVCLVPAKPLHGALSNLCQCWTAVVILAKMMFQLNLVSAKIFQNCTDLNITDTSSRNSEYLGLVKTGNLAEYLRFYIAILLILTLEKIVKLHQKQYYGHPAHERPLPGIIFPGITRKQADDNIRHCIKFFVNYGFYKFGLELCFIMTMITMVVRLDIYSVLYGLLLCIILPMNRRITYVLWQPYLAFLVLVLLFEYLLCLGLPPAFCLAYPWDDIGIGSKLQIYLYLPNYDRRPNQMKLLLDFLQLLFASLQLFVFKIEKNADYRELYGGGDNDCDIDKMDRMVPGQPNDFIAKKTSYLDYLKAGLFQYMFWLTLMIVFIAGVARISFLCLGYLLACFIFLWWGNDLLIKPLRSVLRLWGVLLGYNFAVIICKSCLQLAGCVYINKLTCDICWLVQLFGIVCLQPDVYKLKLDTEGCSEQCKVGKDESGLVYDSIAFALLLLQMRIFKSSYFQYVVFDLRVQNRLASRGAEVINSMLIQRVEKRKQDEQETLNKIRRKVDRIRRRQKNHDTSDHYLALSHSRNNGIHVLPYPYDTESDDDQLVRSGGEFMFDAEDEAEDIESTDHFGEDKEVTSEEDTVGPLDILSTAIYRGTRRALIAASRRSSKTESDPPEADKRFSNESKTESIAEESAFEEQEDEQLALVGATSAGPRQRTLGAGGDGPDRSASTSRLRTVSTNEDAALSKKGHSLSDATILSTQDAAAGVGELSGEVEEDEDDKDGGESCWTRFKMTMLLAWKFIAAFLDYVIKTLDAISDAYRKVLNVLKKEIEQQKKELRQKQAIENGEYPAERYIDISAGRRSRIVNDESDRAERSSSIERRTQSCPTFDHNGADAKKDSVSAHSKSKTRHTSGMSTISTSADEELLFRREMPRLFLLVIAFWEASVSQSEVVCFFAMILNHMVSASLLSLPYPLAVFLWAMLAVPRPAKTYWVTVITYAEAVVVVKYMFQFAFFPWNADSSSANEGPFWPPRIIGIEKMDQFAAYDLFLLLCLFYHRSVLKSHGLWRDSKAAHDDLERAVDTVTSAPPSPLTTRAQQVHQASQPQAAASCPTSPMQLTLDQEIPAPPLSPGAITSDRGQGTDVVGNEIVPIDGNDDANSSHTEREGKQCCSCIRVPFNEFYNEVINPRYNAPTDVYAPMFFCDLIAFVITVFGYSYFRPVVSTGLESEEETPSRQETTGETVKSVIEDNKVPIPFLVMLLAQFILMLIDRAIFLRKQVFGKFMFQILLVLVVHSWLFFILPAVTNRPFSDNLPAQLWYLVKCVYFGLSAYQIHCGYPTRILGNFLTKKYNYFNLVLFKGFLVVPFLLEMRVLMDWIWTDTTMALTHWLQMEDIYANIFVIKCFRDFEKNWPTPRGTQVSALVKYGVGGLVLFLLIFVIWFPLLVFSLLTTVYVPYPPTDCTVTVRLGGYQPLFRMSAQQQTLQKISASEYTILREGFKSDPAASGFMNQYQLDDIYVATITSQSTAVWGISPPSRSQLHKELENRTDLFLYFDIAITRDPPKNPNVAVETVANSFSLLLDASDPLIYEARRNLSCMIRGDLNSSVPECLNNTGQVLLNKSYPVYVHVPPSGKPLSPQEKWSMENAKLGNMSLKLKTEGYDSWWELYNHPNLDGNPLTPGASIVKIYTFNDRVAPGTISVITSYGIIGLYISLVFVIGRFVRMFVSGISYRMMFEELPDVDHILNLCLDIYLVRERHELELEEQLFAKLHFLFRSPSMLLQWTKYKQE